MTESDLHRMKVLHLNGKGEVPELFVEACNLIRAADSPSQAASFAYQFGYLEGSRSEQPWRPLFERAAQGVGWTIEWKE